MGNITAKQKESMDNLADKAKVRSYKMAKYFHLFCHLGCTEREFDSTLLLHMCTKMIPRGRQLSVELWRTSFCNIMVYLLLNPVRWRGSKNTSSYEVTLYHTF